MYAPSSLLSILLATLAFAQAFRPIPATPHSRSTQLWSTVKHKLDKIIITGDLQPVSNNVLVRVKQTLDQTEGGLFIPDNAKVKQTEGIVVAAGLGRIHPDTALQMEMAVKVGDSVLYGEYDGSEMIYDDLNHQLIKDDDVLLVFPGKVATIESVTCVKDYVLVLLPPREVTNIAGIVVNVKQGDGTLKRPDNGEVVKVGPGRQAGNGEYMKVQVKPGDKCRFRDYAGTEVKIEHKEYVVIKSYDILSKW